MGITSAGMQSRDADCGGHGAHQNDATDSAEYNGSLSRITSTAAS
ncbi:TPA: hypothetical protein R4E33_002845 [Salmonella enterica subsp. enterica serovar Muenchen]|nr:hypothetical protein [Salmonella enterica subsp. enterica serovar Muenchen]